MKKIELIEQIANNIDSLNKSVAKKSVDLIIHEIATSIKSGKGIEIRGFGSFLKKHKDERIGINPKTKERTQVPAKDMPFFKTGKDLKKVVNNL